MKTVLVLVAAGMGALTLTIIFVGFLATGATRRLIYNTWRNRVAGRISCAIVCKLKLKTFLFDFVLYSQMSNKLVFGGSAHHKVFYIISNQPSVLLAFITYVRMYV